MARAMAGARAEVDVLIVARAAAPAKTVGFNEKWWHCGSNRRYRSSYGVGHETDSRSGFVAAWRQRDRWACSSRTTIARFGEHSGHGKRWLARVMRAPRCEFTRGQRCAAALIRRENRAVSRVPAWAAAGRACRTAWWRGSEIGGYGRR